MAKDGLLFKMFAKINDKTKTPLLSTVICGIFAGKTKPPPRLYGFLNFFSA